MTRPAYDDAGFVAASNYRIAVMRRLDTGPSIPTQIAEDTDYEIAHVSRALGRLRDRGLVELLVSEDRTKGRVYGPTDEGTKAVEAVDELGLTPPYTGPA